MLIIPITEEERIAMERTLQTTATARMILNSIPPLASPKRRDSISTQLTNLHQQTVVTNLLNVISDGEELHRKYNDVDTKTIKMGMVKK